MWGNCELIDGDMVHGWVAGEPWDAWKLDFEARVHGDGIFGDSVWISVANRPKGDLNSKYWCTAVPDSAAYRNLRTKIKQGSTWSKFVANIRAEPKDLPPLSDHDQQILRHLVKRHCLSPSHALAVRQVLDESHASQH